MVINKTQFSGSTDKGIVFRKLVNICVSDKFAEIKGYENIVILVCAGEKCPDVPIKLNIHVMAQNHFF